MTILESPEAGMMNTRADASFRLPIEFVFSIERVFGF
jgi:hypothetical protein